MKRKRFTEEQLITILKANEAGSAVVDLACHHSVTENTIYRLKSRYGGMEVSDARRLRALEAENAKLKRLFVDAMWDNQALREINAKKWKRRRHAGQQRSLQCSALSVPAGFTPRWDCDFAPSAARS